MAINENEFVNFLEEFLMEEEAKELEIAITGEEEQDAPMIDSLQKANYFLKLIKNIDKDIETINTLCDEEINKTIDRIVGYRDSQTEPLLKQRAYFARLLENFTKHELENSNKKSIKLPNGVLSVKKQQPLWEYDDEEILKFLTSIGSTDLINTKIEEKIDKVKFKKAVSFDDEGIPHINDKEIPNLAVKEREDKFTIK